MGNEFDQFAQGRVNTFEWALEAEAVGTVEPRTFVRKLACPRLYATPSDTWQQVWQRAADWLGEQGEYEPHLTQLELWVQREGDGSIEASTTLEHWPDLAHGLRAGARIQTGMVAVRTSVGGLQGSPGVTIVVETPSGGAAGALMLVQQLGEEGIGGCLATQEAEGRWGIVRLIYSPCWYADAQDRSFGVDWARWARNPGDQNESKRLWCEYAVLAVNEAMREIPGLCFDSILFDEYSATDRLGFMSKAALRRLCSVEKNELLAELAKISAKAPAFSRFQRHWDKIAARKRIAEMVESEAFWDEIQRRAEIRTLAEARTGD